MKRFQGLFIKAVVVLLVISMVPVLIIGYRVLKINSRLLTNEFLQKQQLISRRLASGVYHAIFSQEQLLAQFADLHTDFASHDLITQADLSSLTARSQSLFYLVIFSPKGKQIFDAGTYPPGSLDLLKSEMLAQVNQNLSYISPVYYTQGKPFVWLAEPLHRKAGDNTVTSVLAAAMDLEQVNKNLDQTYPLDMDALLVTPQGDILSYNAAPEGVDSTQAQALHEKLRQIREQLGETTCGEIALTQGPKLLACSALVRGVNWNVYVFQPASVASNLLLHDLLHASLWDIAVISLAMLLFVGVVSYVVIIPITRPVERLRAAAVKLREQEDFAVSRADVEIPHNEIGELAEVFVGMSQALHQRRQELIHTQQQLSQMNQILEQRVADRTRELQAATEELVKSERLAAIGQMASIISHEIRNPLAVISNATRLIKTLLHTTDQKLLKQFHIIESEIRQANSIISEVLGYARTRELILSTVEVNSFLRELILSNPLPAAVTLREELAPQEVRIKVDAEEIKQALRNIISNAIEAMPTGGTVTVGAKIGKRLVCIYVSDTGPGLSEDVRREMFSPFFTTKARGTGLGLAVVRKAITRHKGKLFIKSALGKGTTFQIYLKIYRKTGDTNYGKAS